MNFILNVTVSLLTIKIAWSNEQRGRCLYRIYLLWVKYKYFWNCLCKQAWQVRAKLSYLQGLHRNPEQLVLSCDYIWWRFLYKLSFTLSFIPLHNPTIWPKYALSLERLCCDLTSKSGLRKQHKYFFLVCIDLTTQPCVANEWLWQDSQRESVLWWGEDKRGDKTTKLLLPSKLCSVETAV